MLSYAFHVLRQSNYEEIGVEDFENIHDMFACILGKGVARQLKQGLYREYITKTEDLSVLHGKVMIQGTIKNRIQRNMKLNCEYDELSENNIFNQILKTTILILLHHPNIKDKNKEVLKREILFFDTVDYIEPSEIRWDKLRFQKNNQEYRMLNQGSVTVTNMSTFSDSRTESCCECKYDVLSNAFCILLVFGILYLLFFR